MPYPIEGVSNGDAIPQPSPSPSPSPSPAPQPATAASDSADSQSKSRAMHDLGDRVVEAAGLDPARWTGSYAVVAAWLERGYDTELDILATVRRIARREAYQPPASLKFFDRAIDQAYRERQAKLPPQLRPKPKVASPEQEAKAEAYVAAMEKWDRQGRPGVPPKPQDFGVQLPGQAA